MSYDFGPSLEYVHKTEDELNGRTEAALLETLEALEAENAPVEIVVSLQDVIDRRRTGGCLLGTSLGERGRKGVDTPYDGLLYAETEGPLASGAFSVVRLGTWVREASIERLRHDIGDLGTYMTSLALKDPAKTPGDRVWGVPVERLTFITGYQGEDGYRYGQRADLQAVAQMDAPDGLKEALARAASEWHETELAAKAD